MRLLVACCWVLVLFVSVPGVHAQEPVQRIEDAELIFQQGVDAFEEADYGMAYRRFRLVYNTYEVNRKTTAAILMAGKALFRLGEYEDAAALLDRLVRTYPSSGYVEEAQRVRRLALEELGQRDERARVRDLGIVLPLQDQDATLTQALFTGIRIAVEEHNRANPSEPIRMVFRETDADPDRAAQAVTNLARSGAEAIVGPLYSREAIAAATAAERSEIVLIAPLANDESVSNERDFVFQANPTITTRGRLMARFAMRGLMLNNFGVIAERDQDQISERMAEGFQEEVMLQGGELAYYRVLESRTDWNRLQEIMGPDTLTFANAVYMPVSGGESIARIDAALSSLDRMGLRDRIRVLGNTEWHRLPNTSRAGRYDVTYTNDFYVNEDHADVRSFSQEFQEIVGQRPDPSQTIGRLAFTGYDVTRFLLTQISRETSSPLRDRIRAAPPYQGLGLRIDFTNGNVNEALYYFRYRDGAATLLR